MGAENQESNLIDSTRKDGYGSSTASRRRRGEGGGERSTVEGGRGYGSMLFIVVIGIVFHLVSMYSIFDIYFQSPLEHGMQPFAPIQHADETSDISKRLVFIVADGLRADKFFERLDNPDNAQQSAYSAPYLRSIIESGEASWGVSHTRVPTESRPGHVAMFAGFYEDMSAIFTGWKENLVEFDNVFNQSSYVLQIGSPDVVNMFEGDHIDTYHYPAEMEDFAAEDHTSLDKWVFDKLDELLDMMTNKEEEELTDEARQLRTNLHGNQVIIFLHLLGIDTSGHTNRPNSEGYIDSIRYVDNGVKHVQKRLDEFFGNDGKTTYIFTADHGMTTRGSHGDGDPECTRTPLLVWGNGVRKVNDGGHRIIDDGSMKLEDELRYVRDRWNLNPEYRKDILQADMAPLIATYLGINIPVNNVGRVPLSYIGGDESRRAHALCANAKQILEQVRTKEHVKRDKTSLFFRPFAPLSHSDRHVQDMEQMLAKGSYTAAIHSCENLINLSLDGFSYYQTYDWPLLMTAVTLGYVGWMAYILTYALSHFTDIGKSNQLQKTSSSGIQILVNLASVLAFGAVVTYLNLQSAPIQYYAYVAFPIYFFNRTLQNVQLIASFAQRYWSTKILLYAAFAILALELFVIGYYRREIFSVCFIALGIAPTMLDLSADFRPRILWIASCIFMSFFTLLPADYGTDIRLVRIGGVLLALAHVSPAFHNRKQYNSFQKALFVTQWIMILTATWLVHSTEASLSLKQGLPRVNQVLSWSISALSLVLPLFSSSHFKIRLRSVIMAFAVPFIMLSVAYEVLFFVGFNVVLELWLVRENVARRGSPSGKMQQGDFVTALFFIFFLCMGFFGTGNLATVASFEISSVYRFITVFSPFTMTGLLVFKLVVPLMLLTIFFTVLMRITDTPASATFCIILALSDVMTINFFFLVSDYGSWLEIGNAISRFAIGNGMIVLLLLLYSMSQVFVRGVHSYNKKTHDDHDDGGHHDEETKKEL